MSDPTVAESTPTSTAEIATQVMETLESPAEPAAETPSAPSEPAAPPVELSPAAKFLQEKGHKARRDDGRDVWLKYQTVEKMLDDYVGKHRGTWDTDRTRIEQERDALKKDLDELYADARGADPDQFIRRLAGIDQRFQRYLHPPAPPAPPPIVDDPEPMPDLDLGDGRVTYSLDGLKKRDAWRERDLLRKMDDRLKPFAEREKAEKARAEREQQDQQFQQRAKAQVQDAATWPGFKDHAAEILQLLHDDDAKAAAEHRQPSLTLEAAYRQVVIPKLTETDAQKRERLMKEMSEKAGETPTITRTGAGAPKAGPADTRSIAAKTLARLERQGS